MHKVTTSESFSYRYGVLILCMFGSFFFLGGRVILPVLAPSIKELLTIGNAQFGFAMSLLWVCYSLIQFPGGLSSDKLGHRTPIVLGSIVAGAGFLLLSVINTYSFFLLAVLIAGCGGGLYTMVRFRFLSVLFKDDKGRAFGLAVGASEIAGVIAPVGATLMIGVISWRLAFVFAGFFLLLVGLGFHLTVREPYNYRATGVVESIRDAISQITTPQIVFMILMSGLYSVIVQGITTFLPLYMIHAKQLGADTAGMMLSLYFLVGVVVRPLSGFVSDKTDRRVVSAAALLFGGGLLSVLVLSTTGYAWIVVVFTAYSISFLSFSTPWDAYFMDVLREESMGSAFGLVRTVHLFIGSSGPVLIGIGIDTVGYQASFLSLAVISGIGGILIFSLHLRRS